MASSEDLIHAMNNISLEEEEDGGISLDISDSIGGE